jgi:hypothetical protein
MKMSGVSSSSGFRDSARRGSEGSVLNTLSENEAGTFGANGINTPFVTNFEGPSQTYRRPFGCAVLELTQLTKWTVDRAEASQAKEHVLPIFVPSREITFSTLHQAIIASDTGEFEKSPR